MSELSDRYKEFAKGTYNPLEDGAIGNESNWIMSFADVVPTLSALAMEYSLEVVSADCLVEIGQIEWKHTAGALNSFLRFLNQNNQKVCFINLIGWHPGRYLIDLELQDITPESYDRKVYKEIEKRVSKHNDFLLQYSDGLIISAEVFGIVDGIVHKLEIEFGWYDSVENEAIEPEDYLETILDDYRDDIEEWKTDSRRERSQEQKQRIEEFERLFVESELFPHATTKAGRRLLAKEVAEQFGFEDTIVKLGRDLEAFLDRIWAIHKPTKQQ